MNTVYAPDRDEWRAWLEAHHTSEGDVWLITYRKSAGKPSLPYSHAVEEALCFGWIDSVRRSLDDERLAQRFSPRRRGSTYSQTNIERLRKLVDQQKVMPEVLASVRTLLEQPFEWPQDVMAALRADPEAWRHFNSYSLPYRRIRVAYVADARDRPEEFQKRLSNLVRKSAQGKQFGYGIEDFYS